MQWGFQKLLHWPAKSKTVCCHLPFYSFLSSSPALSSPPLNPATHPAILPFSSGTTGPPKGVMVSHRNLITQTLSHVGDGEYYYRAFANFQDTTLVIGMMQSWCWKMTTPPRQFCQCSTFSDLAWQWRVLCGREQNKWPCQSNPKQQWSKYPECEIIIQVRPGPVHFPSCFREALLPSPGCHHTLIHPELGNYIIIFFLQFTNIVIMQN